MSGALELGRRAQMATGTAIASPPAGPGRRGGRGRPGTLEDRRAHLRRVDAATGAVDVLHRIDEEVGIGRQDLLDKGYLARYVRAREGYFFPTVQEQYRRVMLMSVGSAHASYERDSAKVNPEAPINRYRDKQSVEITLKSISFIGKGLAQVRYLATTSDGETTTRKHWIATLRYEYEPDASIPLSVLADNALGFAVTDYRAEPEQEAL